MSHRIVQILGPGCPKCRSLYQRAVQAARELGIECDIRKVSDLDEILAFGIMSTPALVVDGTVRIHGRVPSVDQLKEMLS
jgi:small redox-active disulfide protein 2